MATLTIRKLDDDIYERLRATARRNERSIEAEARHMIRTSLVGDEARNAEPIEAWVERLRAAALPMTPGLDSVALIRAVRDEE